MWTLVIPGEETEILKSYAQIYYNGLHWREDISSDWNLALPGHALHGPCLGQALDRISPISHSSSTETLVISASIVEEDQNRALCHHRVLPASI